MAMVDEGFEPTCFFCGSVAVALTVVWLMRIGLEIPEDVAVVGHADYPIATQISPKLTTMHMPHRQMGIVAVRVLLSRAGLHPDDRYGADADQPVPNLVERQTTGPATTTSLRHKLRKSWPPSAAPARSP